MIPKTIFSIWLNKDGEIPPLIKKCNESKNLQGYDFKLITLENVYRGSEYANTAINANKWVKAADYLRMHYLYEEGGIYLDADVEVLKDFEGMLDDRLFLGRENNGYYSNAVVGAEKGHPFLKKYLDKIDRNFKPDGDMVWECGMGLWSDMFWGADFQAEGIRVYQAEVFFPYDHQRQTTTYLPDTRTFHYFNKSWAGDLPKISVIIPTLGREEGLKRCIDSIRATNYPSQNIEILTYDGEGTVPEKVDRGVKESTGEYIVYAANDTEFTTDSLKNAIEASIRGKKRLVAFNTGTVSLDGGNICEHFVIKRDLLPLLDKGQIFDTDFFHVGVDNYLHAQAKLLDEFYRCDSAKVIHKHWSNGGATFDDVYAKGWDTEKVRHDREMLSAKFKKLYNL